MSADHDTASPRDAAVSERTPSVRPLAVAAWIWVGVPFCYGLYQLIVKIPALFGA